jgi:hypothetical protein
MLAEVGEQEAMGWNPAGRFEHGQGALKEVGRSGGCDESGQGGTERWGARSKAAQPELAALAGRWRRRSAVGRRREQTGEQPQRNHGDAEAQIGQGEVRQQGDGATAEFAQIAAHADQSVEAGIDEGAGVEAVRGERLPGLALRATSGAMPIGVGELLQVVLDGAGEWV